MRKGTKAPRFTLTVNPSIPRWRQGVSLDPEPAGERLENVPAHYVEGVKRAPMFADGLVDGVYQAVTLLAGRPVFFLVYAGKVVEWRRQDDASTVDMMVAYLWQLQHALETLGARPVLSVVRGGLIS